MALDVNTAIPFMSRFYEGGAAVMLAAARCKYVAEGGWGSRRYLDTGLLDGWDDRKVLKSQQEG